MSNDLRELLERIKTESGIANPEKIALLSRVTLDAAALQARALAGEDVSRELAVVAATAANLDERARQVITSNVMAWIQKLLATALGVAIAG